MIKTSRILSIILMLVIASASWTGAKAQYWEAKGGRNVHIGDYYFTLYEDEVTGAKTAIVTDKQYSGSQQGSNSYTINNIAIPATIESEDAEGNPATFTVIGIDSYAFYGSTNVKRIDIPKTVVSIGRMAFEGCTNLEQITVNPESQSFYAKDNVLYDFAQTELIACAKTKAGKFTVPEDVTKIDEFAFSHCVNITEIVLPNGLTEIGNGAFWGCNKMTSINIPTSLRALGESAFRNASSLTSNITIPASVSTISIDAFNGCSKISSVTITDGVTEIADNAFKGCSKITSIDLPASVNKLGNSSFANTGLTSISIPSAITSIPSAAFSGCKLTAITFSKGLKTIGTQAFYNNGTSIQEVIIPESVTSIANNAFDGTNVSNFYINNIPSKIAIGANNPFKADGVTIHVFTMMKSIFQNATNWSKYASKFVDDIEITHVESIALESDKMTVLTNSTNKLNATINPADARVKDVVYTSSNPNVILIIDPATGIFSAGANEGDATVTCTAADGSGVFATCSLTVKKSFTPAESLTLNKTNESMEVGNTLQLKATISPTNATYKKVVWISDNENVATVSETGDLTAVVTAVGSGNATITAISQDGAARAKCKITVTYGTYILTDGEDYKETEDNFVKTLKYVRNFKNTNWQPLYVPFRMSYEDWSDQFEVARLLNMHTRDTNDDGVADEWAMEFVRVKEGTLIENHPYIIRAKEKGVKTITLNNTTIYPAEYNSIECASTEYSYEFKGTYTEFDPKSEEGIYVMGGGSFGKPTSTTKVNPNRFYLKITAKDGQTITMTEAKIIIVDEFGFEETTAINSVESDQNNVTAVYNVNGIKQTSTKQGLNIIKMADGTTKKIFVK